MGFSGLFDSNLKHQIWCSLSERSTFCSAFCSRRFVMWTHVFFISCCVLIVWKEKNVGAVFQRKDFFLNYTTGRSVSSLIFLKLNLCVTNERNCHKFSSFMDMRSAWIFGRLYFFPFFHIGFIKLKQLCYM